MSEPFGSSVLSSTVLTLIHPDRVLPAEIVTVPLPLQLANDPLCDREKPTEMLEGTATFEVTRK